MRLLKILVPIVILKKVYSKPYSTIKKQVTSDEEQDAIDDAKSDR